MKEFGIIGFQRTGTTALLRALCKLDRISGYPLEISLPAVMAEPSYSVLRVEAPEVELQKLATGFLETLKKISCPANSIAWGWKTAVGSVEGLKGSLQRLKTIRPETKIIYCCRKDLVAQIASAQLADARGRWQAWERGQKSARPEGAPDISVKVNPHYLFWMLNETERLSEIIHGCGLPVLELQLEDDYNDFLGLLDKVLQFLGLQKLQNNLNKSLNEGKVSPAPESYITNYVKMKELLEGLRSADNRNKFFFNTLGLVHKSKIRVANLLQKISSRLKGDFLNRN